MGIDLKPLPCAGVNREGGSCRGPVEPRYSLGIYAGRWCDKHWATSGYRKEGREGFDPADAGEEYEPDSWNDPYDGGWGDGW